MPYNHDFYPYIRALWNAGFTAGRSTEPQLFCLYTILDRAQSAVFLLRGQFGAGYVPPLEPWDTFGDDLTQGTWAEKWAEGMWLEGLTAGCRAVDDPLMYCPLGSTSKGASSRVWAAHDARYELFTPARNRHFVCGYDGYGILGNQMGRASLLGWFTAGVWICQDGKPLFCPGVMLDRAWGAYLFVQAKDLPLP